MQKSYWQKQRPLWECPQLNEDQETDIAIGRGRINRIVMRLRCRKTAAGASL